MADVPSENSRARGPPASAMAAISVAKRDKIWYQLEMISFAPPCVMGHGFDSTTARLSRDASGIPDHPTDTIIILGSCAPAAIKSDWLYRESRMVAEHLAVRC